MDRVGYSYGMETRKPYPSDVNDDEWTFVAPYLTLMTLDAAQREHDLRDVFNALRYLARGGIPWRMLPNDLPPWAAVYQQDPAVASGGLLRGHRSRPESDAAPGRGAQGSA